MKNFSVPLFCFVLLLGSPVLQAQRLAQSKPEFALYTGFNLHGWDNSSGPTVGLEAAFPLAGRLGLALGWGFGQNLRPTEPYLYNPPSGNDRFQRFFNSEIGLARTGKSGRWRFGAGISHQYLPKPLLEHQYSFGFCGTGMTDAELKALERQYARIQQLGSSALNLFGASLSGAWRWPLGKRLFGSVGMKMYLLKGPEFPQPMRQESRVSMAEVRFLIGLRN
ncbi:MAG: hypothetical protein ACK4Q5_08090 [Saprospiraceae bacterium]